jgi:type IV pilus assembly protein PilM
MGLFSPQKQFFGLDISGTSVKVVELRHGPSKPQLLAYGGMTLPAGSMTSDSSVDRQNVANAIKQTVKRAKIQSNQVVAALPGSAVFTSIISMPQMPKSELAESIRWQAKQYVPSPLDEVILDWHIVSEGSKKDGEKGEIEVMLIAAPINMVQKYIEIINDSGFKPLALEIEPLALTRAVIGVKDEPVVLVDIGQASTEISIVEKGIVRLNRNTTAGGGALTRAISQSLGIDANRAEQFKRDFGLKQDKLEGQIPKAVQPVLDTLFTEIRRSLEFYRDQPHTSTEITQMVIVGGTAQMPEFLSALSAEFGLEVKIGDPWASVNYSASIKDQLSEIAPSFAVTVGLAMREL